MSGVKLMGLTEAEAEVITRMRGGGIRFAPREESILEALINGICNIKQLSETLFLSIGTTRVYTSRLYLKLRVYGFEVNNLAELTSWACARAAGRLEGWRGRKIPGAEGAAREEK